MSYTLITVNYPLEHMDPEPETALIGAMEAKGFERDGSGTDFVTRDVTFASQQPLSEEARVSLEQELNAQFHALSPIKVHARQYADSLH